jgi:hypothetical protein
MITIQTDEEVHELDVELIEVFAMALIDRDKDTMNDLMYIVEDRMADEFDVDSLDWKSKQHLLMQR